MRGRTESLGNTALAVPPLSSCGRGLGEARTSFAGH